MNNRKNKIIILILFLFVVISSIAFMAVGVFDHDNKINYILKTDSYSYLSKPVQAYILEVYEETNELILTEKNKIKNVPYLNPKYVEYLELSDEEKSRVSLIPEVYVIDYVPVADNNKTIDYQADNLPTYYNLGNVDGKNFLSPMYDQNPWGLCWAFATIEQAESYLMIKNNQSYSSSSERFSVRQLDYATSYDGITDYDNEIGSRNLTTGGNFYDSFSIMSYGLSLTDANGWPYSYSSTSKLNIDEVLNFGDSKYELNSSVIIPKLDASLSESEKQSYMNQLKKYIKNYGGAYVGTVSPQSTCGFRNADGTYAIVDTGKCGIGDGHAMHIIGWDDEYQYSYCDNNNTHFSVNSSGTCNSGTLKSGTGAWILKNSWGDRNVYKNVYLTYSSSNAAIGVITSLTKMDDRKWDNNYYKTIFSNNYMYNVTIQNMKYTKKINTPEKVEKVKFFTSGVSGKYSISIITSSNTYENIKTVTVNYPGIYTIDLSKSNIILNDSEFTIKLQSTNGTHFIKNSISVFTSNLSEDVSIETQDLVGSNVAVDANNNFKYVVYSDTKNILSDEMVSYSLYRNGVDYSEYIVSVSGNIVAMNNINANLVLKSNLPYGTYILRTEYSDYYSESNIYVPRKNSSQDYYEIIFDANGGEGTMLNQLYILGSVHKINDNNFIKPGYKFVEWNTKADGSGIRYENQKEISLTNNLTLYAQWERDDNQHLISYLSNDGTNKVVMQYVYHNVSTKLDKNTFARTGYTFIGWNTKIDGSGTTYLDEKSITLTSDIMLYAQWEINKHIVTFNANFGQNATSTQKIPYNTNTKLIKNSFVRNGYKFIEWNTKADGSGSIYADEQSVMISEDMMLYAQWEINKYVVTFEPNGGSGTMPKQEYTFGEAKEINKNQFTRTGYTFIGWNTKSDGSGKPYTDKQLMNITKDTTLYAQWEISKYMLTFNANGGSGTMPKQEYTYGVTKEININIFTKAGYEFDCWNTKSDGSGKSYKDQEKISLDSNLTLYAQWRDEIPYVINKYSINADKYIDLIDINTTEDEFKSNIILGDDYTVIVDTKNLKDKKVLYTGGKTKIYLNNELYMEYTNIVRGDANGDGVMDIFDYIRIMKDIMNDSKLVDVYKIGADVNRDNVVDIFDYIRIMKRIMEGE